MKNIIAIIWDFDKTLIDGYMQDPIFEDYNVDAHKFWTEVNGHSCISPWQYNHVIQRS